MQDHGAVSIAGGILTAAGLPDAMLDGLGQRVLAGVCTGLALAITRAAWLWVLGKLKGRG